MITRLRNWRDRQLLRLLLTLGLRRSRRSLRKAQTALAQMANPSRKEPTLPRELDWTQKVRPTPELEEWARQTLEEQYLLHRRISLLQEEMMKELG